MEEITVTKPTKTTKTTKAPKATTGKATTAKATTAKAAKVEAAPKAAKTTKAASAAKTTRKTQKVISELVELTESLVSDEERREMIAEAAYFLAEQRGFDPSEQVNDWLEAERSVDEMLKKAVKEATF